MTVVIPSCQQLTRGTANFARGMTLMKQLLTLALDSDVLETLTDVDLDDLQAIDDFEAGK